MSKKKAKGCGDTPCRECPFRRDSLPGWIGAHDSVNEIIQIVNFDQAFPCHLTINYEDPDWQEKAENAPHCVGALAFMNNSCKRSRDPRIDALADKVGRRDDVFQWPHEMVEHHETKSDD